jgi:hypothetical protein
MPTLTLSAPQFGNTWEVNFLMLPKRNGSNELLIAKEDTRPTIDRIKLTYPALSITDRDTTWASLIGLIGEEIILTDWETTEWVGSISGDIEVTQSRRGCGYDISLEFEGIKNLALTPP